jgi:hypothetical protein
MNATRARIGGFGLVLLSLIMVVGGLQLLSRQVPVRVQIQMAVTTSEAGQLFVDKGAGYTEGNSLQMQLIPDGRMRNYTTNFWVPPKKSKVRIDPGTASGEVHLCSIRFESGYSYSVFRASELLREVRTINALSPPVSDGRCVAMSATGPDPHFEVKLKSRLFWWPWTRLLLGVLALLAGLAMFVRAVTKFARPGAHQRAYPAPAWGVMAAVAVAAALSLAGLGCGEFACSPRAVKYGAGILLAAVSCAVVGLASSVVFGRDCQPRIFSGLVIGQAVLILYVYVRSAVARTFPGLPMVSWEFHVLIVGAAVYLAYALRHRQELAAALRCQLPVALGTVVALSLVVADRELPRLLMLSTDPDIHAFLANQIRRFGYIPSSQGDWGGEAFNYPAGSPALIYAWSKVSGLEIANAAASLPLFQFFMAPLLISEALAPSHAGRAQHTIAHAAMIAVAAIGLAMPLFLPFSHMEGYGRQAALPFFAAIVVLVLRAAAAPRPAWGIHVLLLLLLAAVAALNPVNALLPVILVGITLLGHAVHRRIVPWQLAISAAFLVPLLLDPYFYALFSGASGAQKLNLSTELVDKSAERVLSDSAAYFMRAEDWIRDLLLRLLPWDRLPGFAIALAGVSTLLACLRPRWRPKRVAVVTLLVLVGVVAVLLAVLAGLGNDRAYYLLHPYFLVSIGQMKIIILLMLSSIAIVHLVARYGYGPRTVAGIAVLIMVTAIPPRFSQPVETAPRVRQCYEGSCLPVDDLALLRAIESAGGDPLFQQARRDGARILAPNVVAQMGLEEWAFPVGSARLLGQIDTLPVAFYYMQGDTDFTASAYRRHVCERFDTNWMKKERIRFLFVSARTDYACVKDLETMATAGNVVMQRGQALLLSIAVAE